MEEYILPKRKTREVRLVLDWLEAGSGDMAGRTSVSCEPVHSDEVIMLDECNRRAGDDFA